MTTFTYSVAGVEHSRAGVGRGKRQQAQLKNLAWSKFFAS